MGPTNNDGDPLLTGGHYSEVIVSSVLTGFFSRAVLYPNFIPE